jgi:MFS family permease
VNVRQQVRGVAVAMLSNTIAVLPVFLVAALAVLMRRELDFGEGQLGLAVSGYFAVAAATSVPGGRLAERRGAPFAMALASAVSLAGMLGIALAASSWLLLVVLLAFSGISNGVAQPASNLAIAQLVRGERQGFAFGVKQAAIPIGTLLAGLSLPAFGLTVGWRWGLVAGALLAVPVGIACARLPLPVEHRDTPRIRQGDASTGPMILLATAAAMAAAADSAVGSFHVESVVAAGIGPGSAGLLYALGSVAGVAGRVLWGWLGDVVSGGRLIIVAGLIAVGALATAMFALSTRTAVLVLATVLVFGCGWGWNGLFNFAVVRLNPRAPGAATGITQTGTYLGGVAGPVLFGLAVDRWSYGPAWLGAGAVSLAAAAAVAAGRRALRADRARRLGAVTG